MQRGDFFHHLLAEALEDDARIVLHVARGEAQPFCALAPSGTGGIVRAVSVEEIKQGIAALPLREQNEVTAFLFHLRHAADAEHQQRVASRLDDRDPAHWLTPEEFERRLDAK